MAKANLTLPNGTKVDIEGTSQEVAKVLKMFSQPIGEVSAKTKPEMQRRPAKVAAKQVASGRRGPQPLITELAEEGYFKGKRVMADIQKKLEEKGHIYAQESLSPALLRLTRKKTLRRIKEKKGWVYVNY